MERRWLVAYGIVGLLLSTKVIGPKGPANLWCKGGSGGTAPGYTANWIYCIGAPQGPRFHSIFQSDLKVG